MSNVDLKDANKQTENDTKLKADSNGIERHISNEINDQDQLKRIVEQHQLLLHRQNSLRLSRFIHKENDLESRINRLYSFLLVKYHWAFLLLGIFITLVLTGVGFVKQPLPNFLDPRRGFGARGEGTLTSKLIVMKNVNTELTKYYTYILDVYEDVKKANRSDFDQYYQDNPDSSGQIDENNINNDDQDETNDENNGDEETEEEQKQQPVVRKKRDLSDNSNQLVNNYLESESFNEFKSRTLWKNLNGLDIISMLPINLTISSEFTKNKQHAFNTIEHCNFSLGLDENLEYYFVSSPSASYSSSYMNYANLTNKSHGFDAFFNDIDTEYSTVKDLEFDENNADDELKQEYIKEKEENLLNIRKLKSLCEWDKKMLRILVTESGIETPPCYFSLPQSIALLNNKTDCSQLNAQDVRNFLSIVRKCYVLHKTGILYAAAEEYKQKPEIINLLNKNNPFSKFIQEAIIKDNICFKKNLMHLVYEHLIDRQFLSTKTFKFKKSTKMNNNTDSNEFSLKSFNVKISTLMIINEEKSNINQSGRVEKQFGREFVYDLYLKSFHHNTYDDKETSLIGINLIGVREDAAMRFISQEMKLVALAIILIVIVTLLYLKSIVISMIVNLGVGMSVGVAFFAYRIVFDIDLFPFINMMAAFLLIGIACDDVYVLFDSWYTEKAKVIMEDLPDMIEKQYSNPNDDTITSTIGSNTDEYLLPTMFIERKFIQTKRKKKQEQTDLKSGTEQTEAFLINRMGVEELNKYELNPAYVQMALLNDEQMIRAMGGTLRHAASSIFVTSFTTAAAFLTNYITKLPYVQLFGVFTGICILVYFIMVITMIAAFVVSYEKHIQLWRCKLKPKCTQRLEELFAQCMEMMALLNYKCINKSLPKILIRLRYLWFSMFLCFGIFGMIAVFYKPQLKPPPTWRYQFFKNGNLFENFEFNLKDQFWAYINAEKRNLTNPEIFFVFGILDKDTGRVFNPDDDGYLVYDKHFDFLSPDSQVWLNNFINVSIANRRDLFLVDEIVTEWNNYLYSMQQYCYETMGISVDQVNTKIFLPYGREQLSKCRDEINSFIVNSSLSIANFESLMSSFPRRIIFISKGRDVNGILLRVNANQTFSDHHTVNEYYHNLKQFHANTFEKAPRGLDSGWFISVGFALYDLQSQLITGTYSSLVASMAIALVILLLTSGNVIISIFAIITISFSIADTVAIFVFLGWNLSILESVIIIMSVGLSVDFSCHYGVAYINSDVKVADQTLAQLYSNEKTEETGTSEYVKKNNSSPSTKSSCKLTQLFNSCVFRCKENDKERFMRINDVFNRVGSAVLMAAFTTFLAGMSMFPSNLTSFSRMGQFLMLVMCTSYLFATFFFVPMCAIFGPTKNFGALHLKTCAQRLFSVCTKRITHTATQQNEEKKKKQNSIPFILENDNNSNNNAIEVACSSSLSKEKNQQGLKNTTSI